MCSHHHLHVWLFYASHEVGLFIYLCIYLVLIYLWDTYILVIFMHATSVIIIILIALEVLYKAHGCVYLTADANVQYNKPHAVSCKLNQIHCACNVMHAHARVDHIAGKINVQVFIKFTSLFWLGALLYCAI